MRFMNSGENFLRAASTATLTLDSFDLVTDLDRATAVPGELPDADGIPSRGIHVNALRVRAFPFPDEIADFVASHPWVFVIEQNRDAQLRMMLINEQELNPAKLEPILHFDGTPITARFIIEAIATPIRADNVEPIAKKKGRAA